MTNTSNVKHLLAAVLLSGISCFTTAGIAENKSGTAEATAAEAALSFRDLTLLEKAYITTKPEVRDGTTPVGELGVDAGEAADILKLAEEIAAGTYGRYDSLLIAHKDKLLFESYFRRGRINLAHPQASATKGYTSLILGRAIELGYLSMDALDKPLISFLKDIDRTHLAEGAENITLHKALTMHGGLTVSDEEREELEKNPELIKGQRLVQAVLERSDPVTAETQVYKYGNFNPMLVMAVIDAVVPGTAEEFIKTEVLGKLGISNYSWDTHPSGLPQAGWMVNMTSRDMLKFGSVVLNEGKWNGEQFIPEDYLAKATSGLVKPTQDWMPESYRYGYYWYHKPIKVGDKSYDATLAWGGGDQRVIVVDALDLVVVVTGHDNEGTLMNQIEATVLPAFVK